MHIDFHTHIFPPEFSADRSRYVEADATFGKQVTELERGQRPTLLAVDDDIPAGVERLIQPPSGAVERLSAGLVASNFENR